jgi:hypothetical protein
MRKTQLIFLAIVCLFIGSASFSQKNSKGLINAEKAFAAFTLTHTVKEGFLTYMDSAGLVFRQGNAVNALESFRQQKAAPGVLTWGPSFAVISTSGDMGVTAGPYEFREKSSKDTPVSKGTFSSIWHINQNGEWKNLADLGVTHTGISALPRLVEEIHFKNEEIITFSFENILLNDRKLNEAIQQRDKVVWQTYLSAESRLNIEGHTPYKGIDPINAAILSFPAGMILQSLYGGMASSRDFAYTYGTVLVGDKKDNYLRAWIYRNGYWQVILQTIKW